MSSWFFILAVALVIDLRCDSAMKRRKPITVNKCCNEFEKLSQNEDCVMDSENDWWPLIVMVLKQTYFEPKGSAPQFMKYVQRKPSCEKPELFFGPHKLALFSNGSLYLSEKHKFIEPNNYCADKDAALVCEPNTITSNTNKRIKNIRKCCVMNAKYNASRNACVSEESTNELTTILSDFDILYGFPQCTSSKFITIAESFDNANLDRKTNSLKLASGRELEWHDFCIENVDADSISELKVITCAEHLSISFSEMQPDIRFILFPTGLLVSVIFLSATLAIRYILPANHHHMLHWRCQTFYVVCLLIGDLLLAMTQLFGRNATTIICVSVAVSMHFFFLSAFFWLNTMCFNIYCTFKDFRPTSLKRKQEKKRLCFYKMYAWGVPLVISGSATIMDHFRKTNETYLQPMFCETEYWFAGNLEKFIFFYGPIGLLLFINLAFFTTTARELTCGLWKREEVKCTSERTTLGRVCVKLVVVMGVTWVADVLSWAHGLWFGELYYVWIVTDLINTLQGVFIFIVIGCQPQVCNVFKQLWRSKNDKLDRKNIEGGQRNSSSSQAASSLGGSITNNTFTTSNSKVFAETPC